MRIGVTERGDAGLDTKWADKLGTLDGAVLITKNITVKFARIVLNRTPCPVIIHAGCTGLGGTAYEPNVPAPEIQLNGVKKLIEQGFPKDHIVLRIDPIIPTPNGIAAANQVIAKAREMGLLPGMRVRVSVLDQYPHVVKRFQAAGLPLPYPEGRFQAADYQFGQVSGMLASWPDIKFETCAEARLNGPNIVHTGCVSADDLNLFGLPVPGMAVNMQGRRGCLCLSCKTELLDRKHPCPNNCQYCYWR